LDIEGAFFCDLGSGYGRLINWRPQGIGSVCTG
jgi:hypothetical protein